MTCIKQITSDQSKKDKDGNKTPKQKTEVQVLQMHTPQKLNYLSSP
jgi:hypothetical protein